MPPAAVIGGMAVAGAVAGAMGSKSSTSNSINLAGSTSLQDQLQSNVGNQYNSLNALVNAGPGQQDATNAYQNSQSLAALLGQYSANGGMPSTSDFTQANGLANQAFAGQQTALQQSFMQQMQSANNQAALMGRDGNDPSLQGALRSQQMLQSQQLSANQGSYANQLAMSLPGQRLQYAGQQNQVLQGLATQALANRQAMLTMGNNMLGQQYNYQLGRSGSTATTSSGGGFAGALTGALGGAGAGMKVAGGMPAAAPAMPAAGAVAPQGFDASSYASSGISKGGSGGYSLFSGSGQ